MKTRILIVGLGNPLVGDDGAGQAVLDELKHRGLPSLARAESGETDALRLPSLWRGEPEVWIVDAFAAGAPAGTIHRIPHEQLLALPQRNHSVHRLSLPEGLRWISLAFPEMAPVKYQLYGIEPSEIKLDPGLSPEVERAVGELAGVLLRDLAERDGP